MNKNYSQAPLPFQGQKRKFIKQFKEKLNECPDNATYVDLFGGSGLLSRTVKDKYPTATVVYNDYDHYRQRINAIDATNALLADIRTIVADFPKDKRLPEECKLKVLAFVKRAETAGFVDYITLSANLLFSMKYVTNFAALQKETFYNVIRQSPYDATGYLDGLEIVSEDYKELQEKYVGKPNVIYLVDPPYLSTDVSTYRNYWNLGNYLDVLKVLQNSSYFYFTSNKSHIVELCSWMSTASNYQNPFANAVTTTTHQQMNYNSSYTDIMLFQSLKYRLSED